MFYFFFVFLNSVGYLVSIGLGIFILVDKRVFFKIQGLLKFIKIYSLFKFIIINNVGVIVLRNKF